MPVSDKPAHLFEEVTKNTSMTVYAFLQDFPEVCHPDLIASLYLFGEDGIVNPDHVYPPLGVNIKSKLEAEEASSDMATESFMLSPEDNGPNSPEIGAKSNNWLAYIKAS